MISEHQFAAHYQSTWHAIAPLSDGFWTFENKLVDRVQVPLVAVAPKGMRAIINEAAFRAFCDLHPKQRSIGNEAIAQAIEANLADAIEYIRRFSNAPPVELHEVDAECREESLLLASRLLSYFESNSTTIIRPTFRGCGLLSACEGDLIDGDCLYEIKAGDRQFRLLDLRQLLTYSALAYASESLTFSQIGLFNPRTGLAWRRTLEDVCRSISGLHPSDTLSALVEQFSVASGSR